MKRALFLLAIAASLLTGACTHHVHTDYGQYLVKNEGAANFPQVATSADYYLTPETESHSYEFTSAMGGLANSWALEFGPMLDATMVGRDVRTALGEVNKAASTDGAKGLLVIYDLTSYVFEGFEATVSLNITARKGATELLSKNYAATGVSQGGKMFWGGAFAIKNAVHQSTKSALDQILARFLGDLKKVYQALTAPPEADKLALGEGGLAPG